MKTNKALRCWLNLKITLFTDNYKNNKVLAFKDEPVLNILGPKRNGRTYLIMPDWIELEY